MMQIEFCSESYVCIGQELIQNPEGEEWAISLLYLL